ncbi:MAG: hypothetical protein JNL05_09130 [Flavobacteriales bacterium]|nr:hypothetical protein [Flavobacteriales bacterium]
MMNSPFRTLLLTAVVVCATATNAQRTIRLNAFGGWTFQDKFDISGTYGGYAYNNAGIGDGAHYGGGLEFEVRENKCVELFYQNQSAQGFIDYGLGQFTTDVSVNYAMLGGLGYAPFSDAVHGYGGFNIGAAWFNTDYGNSTKFAWGGKLGLKINASEKVGIKLGAQLLSPVQGAGGGIYFGTGGAGAGVSTYSTMYQFGFTGGLCFTLGQ